MATLRSGGLLRSYSSIRRPSLTSGTPSSGTFSSIAKQQASAEDLIYDNQYAAGLMSPESYKQHLNVRLQRTYNTPRAVVVLQEKIKDVDQKIQDSTVDREYKAGNLTTEQVRDYERAKLDSMTEPGSAAYIQQQQKVQSLTDKAEKEARAAYRIEETKRLSTMPDDSSEIAYSKAQMYQKLANQARLDGDNQQADVLETQMNNALSQAKKAEINDLITNTRLSVSKNMTPGLGVPSESEGAKLYAQLTGQPIPSSGATPDGSKSSPGVASSLGSSSAISRAMEGLDRGQKSLEKLYQKKQETQSYIEAYREAISRATGDQKTQLTIALNNLIDSQGTLDNQIDLQTKNIEDMVVSIQEKQAAAAQRAYKNGVRKDELSITKQENELSDAFQKGEIDKVEYLTKSLGLTQAKLQYSDQTLQNFSDMGDDSGYEKWLQIQSDTQDKESALVQVGNNLDKYEPVVVESQGMFDPFTKKKLLPGEVALQRVENRAQFEGEHVQSGNKYYKIHYPNEIGSDGEYGGAAWDKKIGKLQDNAYVNIYDKDGKENQMPVKGIKVDGQVKNIMIQSDIDEATKSGLFKEVKTGDKVEYTVSDKYDKYKLGPVGKAVNTAQQIAAKGGIAIRKGAGAILDNYKDTGKLIKETVAQGPKPGSLLSRISTGISNLIPPKLKQAAKNIYEGIKGDVQKSRLFEGGPLVKPVQGVEDIIRAEAEKFGVDPDLMLRIANAESKLDPYAAARKSGFDNKTINPKTGKPYPYSSAEGLFQFTDATWQDAIRAGVIPANTPKTDPVANSKAAAYFISKGQLNKWDASKANWDKAATPQAPKEESFSQDPMLPGGQIPVTRGATPQPKVTPSPTPQPQPQQQKQPSFLSNIISSVTKPVTYTLPQPPSQTYKTPSGLISPIPMSQVVKPTPQPNIIQKAVSAVSKVAQPVVQKVQQAAAPAVNKVTSFFSNLFKKK